MIVGFEFVAELVCGIILPKGGFAFNLGASELLAAPAYELAVGERVDVE